MILFFALPDEKRFSVLHLTVDSKHSYWKLYLYMTDIRSVIGYQREGIFRTPYIPVCNSDIIRPSFHKQGETNSINLLNSLPNFIFLSLILDTSQFSSYLPLQLILFLSFLNLTYFLQQCNGCNLGFLASIEGGLLYHSISMW